MHLIRLFADSVEFEPAFWWLSSSWPVDALGTVVQVHIAHCATDPGLDVRSLIVQVTFGAVDALGIIHVRHLPAPCILDKQNDDQGRRNPYDKGKIPVHGCLRMHCIMPTLTFR